MTQTYSKQIGELPLGIIIINRVYKFKVIEPNLWIEKVSSTGFFSELS